MVKTHVKSWFEIWSDEYINYPGTRENYDKNLIILQVEHCTHTDYLVEVIKPEDYKLGYFSSKKEV